MQKEGVLCLRPEKILKRDPKSENHQNTHVHGKSIFWVVQKGGLGKRRNVRDLSQDLFVRH